MLITSLLSFALLVSPPNAFGGALPPWLIERAAALGYVSPTPVQAEAIDVVLSGRDAIIQAKTGSGKTLAYMLPLLAGLKPQSSVQALVLLPTRELASQVAIVARRLAAGSPDRLLVMALLDGSGAKRQRKWLVAQPPQVVVGNVQQVDSVIQARLLRLETLKLLVVDEAAIVFAPPTLPLERIAEALAGVLDEAPPAILAEGQPLNARAAAVRELKERRKRLLLSTPLGARGLDVAHCSHVYLLGVPDSAEDYLHAAGRCGRMGQPGLVTVLCGEKEAFALGRIGNALGIEFLDAREADPE